MSNISIANSYVRRARMGGSPRPSFGIGTVRAGGTGMTVNGQRITIPEARRRIRSLRAGVKANATKILKAAAEPLVEKWKENIDAEGWGPSGSAAAISAEASEGYQGVAEELGAQSTGRYYNSIMSEVDSDLEVHVGSNIPRPSGRGLTQWSYPEALEFGTSVAPAFPTLRPALDEAGPEMEKKTREIFYTMCDRYLMLGTGM